MRHTVHAATHNHNHHYVRLTLVFLILLAIVMFTGPASSSEQPAGSSYQVADDVCLPLLNQHRIVQGVRSNVMKTDRAAPAAALSLIFGVRYAVGPRETGKVEIAPGPENKGIDSEYARAVASYRHCRSQHALESFASN